MPFFLMLYIGLQWLMCIHSYKLEIAFISKGGKGDLDMLKNQERGFGGGGGWRGEGGRERERAKLLDEEFYI